MAEVVGAVASVLTLCQAVSESLGQIIDLYQAPAEVEALQVFMLRLPKCSNGENNTDLGASRNIPPSFGKDRTQERSGWPQPGRRPQQCCF